MRFHIAVAELQRNSLNLNNQIWLKQVTAHFLQCPVSLSIFYRNILRTLTRSEVIIKLYVNTEQSPLPAPYRTGESCLLPCSCSCFEHKLCQSLLHFIYNFLLMLLSYYESIRATSSFFPLWRNTLCFVKFAV